MRPAQRRAHMCIHSTFLHDHLQPFCSVARQEGNDDLSNQLGCRRRDSSRLRPARGFRVCQRLFSVQRLSIKVLHKDRRSLAWLFAEVCDRALSLMPNLHRYMKDGVTCEEKDINVVPGGGISTTPYFESRGIFATNYLCKTTPRFFNDCSCKLLGYMSWGCAILLTHEFRSKDSLNRTCVLSTQLKSFYFRCCNEPGTFGARISATECISLQWVSDSTVVCRAPPGAGLNHSVLLAIDDTEGSQLSFFTRAFTYDAPMVNTPLFHELCS
jgi:hypothetical protein